jgi:hypothetical protein
MSSMVLIETIDFSFGAQANRLGHNMFMPRLALRDAWHIQKE